MSDKSFATLAGRLVTYGRLACAEEYEALLDPDAGPSGPERLREEARRRSRAVFGDRVYARALIEITNRCRNNCLYCGIRHDNRSVARYALSLSDILECCRRAHDAGFRTFVLQGGEDPGATMESVSVIVERIHRLFPDSAITLSLGEWPDEAYESFFRAGATRYLLRHETRNAGHYSRLHPPGMSQSNRLRCLSTLKRIGYQTGTGIMVGSPFQTISDIAEDLGYMAELQPEMIGIGPFIPHASTPFGGFPVGSVELTLRLISILRLMFPGANIPATTALATLSGEGRVRGILAGANVVMPNVTPPEVRGDYTLYDRKACSGKEAIEGLDALKKEIGDAGYILSFEKGDFKRYV